MKVPKNRNNVTSANYLNGLFFLGFILIFSMLYVSANPKLSPADPLNKKNNKSNQPGKSAAAKNKLMDDIYRLMKAKDFAKALELANQGLKTYGSIDDFIKLKYNILVAKNDLEGGIRFIDSEIKRNPKSKELLAAKFSLLFSLNRFQEALDVAIQKDSLAAVKSPWDCMDVVHTYIQMNKREDALDWLQEAAKRGFHSYRILKEPKYAIFQNSQRFFEIIETIKMNIGLGERSKPFSTTFLSGKQFYLPTQRGKVTLIAFWATWCEPCRKEMPMLARIYHQFKNQGFDIIGISLDSDPKRVENFLKNKHVWENACSGLVWEDPVVLQYKINSLPSYWLIDKKGVLRSVDIKDDELRDSIEKLLKEQ